MTSSTLLEPISYFFHRCSFPLGIPVFFPLFAERITFPASHTPLLTVRHDGYVTLPPAAAYMAL